MARGAADAPPERGVLREIVALLGSVKFAVSLFAALAIASILGTILPQAAVTSPEAFSALLARLEREWGTGAARIFMYTHAYDIWHAWWYQALLALILASAVVCTFDRLASVIRRYRQPSVPLAPQAYETLRAATAVETPLGVAECADRVALHLRSRGYRVFRDVREGAAYLLGRRGGLSLFGPAVVHVSVTVCILAGLIGSSSRLGAYRSSIGIVEGGVAYEPLSQTFVGCTSFEMTYSEDPLPVVHARGPRTTFKVTDYTSRVTFYDQTDLSNGDRVVEVDGDLNDPEGASVLPAGTDPAGQPAARGGGRLVGLSELGRAVIRVNQPGHFRGVDYFQKHRVLRGFRIRVTGPDGRSEEADIAVTPRHQHGFATVYEPRPLPIRIPADKATGDDEAALIAAAFAQRLENGQEYAAEPDTAPRPAVRIDRVVTQTSSGRDMRLETVGWATPDSPVVYRGHTIEFVKPVHMTVLEVRRQPGVGLLMAGFVVVGVGLVLCFWVPLREVRAMVVASASGARMSVGMPRTYHGDDAQTIVANVAASVRGGSE